MRAAKVHFRTDARALCGRTEVETTIIPHEVTCHDCRSYIGWSRAYNEQRWDNEADQLNPMALMTSR